MCSIWSIFIAVRKRNYERAKRSRRLQTARDRGHTRYIGYSGDGHAARYAVECGAFDSLQISINIADQEAIELSMPLARERGHGRDRETSNSKCGVEDGTQTRSNSYHHKYWERLRKLSFDFLRTTDPEKTIATALRFTLSVPGVHTAIVGTKKPERWEQNARLLETGALSESGLQGHPRALGR